MHTNGDVGMSPNAKRWTQKEIQILRDNSSKPIAEILSLFPKRTSLSVRNKMSALFTEERIEAHKGEILIDYETNKMGVLRIAKKYDINSSAITRYIISCGALKGRRYKLGKPIGPRNWRWTGFGEMSGAAFGSIKQDAKKRDIPFSITIEYLWDLFLSQDRKCVLCGEVLVFSTDNYIRTASLDRIDYLKGYEEGNLQWVHKRLNIMKNNMSTEEFVGWCSRVRDFFTSTEKKQ
jgi:hypothetical protein